MAEITDQERTKYTKDALAMVGIRSMVHIPDEQMELLWRTVEKVKELGHNFTVRDAAFLQTKYGQGNA